MSYESIAYHFDDFNWRRVVEFNIAYEYVAAFRSQTKQLLVPILLTVYPLVLRSYVLQLNSFDDVALPQREFAI